MNEETGQPQNETVERPDYIPEKLIRDAAEQQELANQLQNLSQQGSIGQDDMGQPPEQGI